MDESPDVPDILLIAAPRLAAALRTVGRSDPALLENPPTRWSFDETVHIWEVHDENSAPRRARIVVSAGPRPPGDDGLPPYLGVAFHGLPNFFLIAGDDPGPRLRYLLDCLAVMKRTASSRIEVRHSTQRLFGERARAGRAIPWRRVGMRIESAFDLSSAPTGDDGVYDGSALVDGTQAVRVRLTGHLDPLDGRYHWQGTIFGTLADVRPNPREVRLTIGDRTSVGRLTERTPWGGYSVAGTGQPPFPLDPVDVTVPVL